MYIFQGLHGGIFPNKSEFSQDMGEVAFTIKIWFFNGHVKMSTALTHVDYVRILT